MALSNMSYFVSPSKKGKNEKCTVFMYGITHFPFKRINS